MYRIMIVDDEEYIVDSLFNFFNDVKHLELDVYKSYSAFDALEWMNKANFDIVITDIRMPGMDGLAMMTKIKAVWPSCRIIFLTGYNEFEYIYSAIKYEGGNYLLKSESYDKILETVENIIDVLKEKSINEEMVKNIQRQNEIALPIIQKEFFLEQIRGNNNTPNNLIYNDFCLPFCVDTSVMLVMICLDNSFLNKSFCEKSQLYNSIISIARVVFEDIFDLFQVEPEPLDILWILKPKCSEDTEEVWFKAAGFLKRTVENIQNLYSEKLSIFSSFITDTDKYDMTMLSIRFNELKQLSRTCLCDSLSMRIVHKETSGNAKLVTETFIKSKHQTSKESIIVSNTKEYIKSHLSEDLTLIQVADAVHYNPSYLSRVFKQEAGVNLFEYINHIRLGKIVDLLVNTDVKINDIALRTGFSSTNYFFQFFRKAKGTTPQEYREAYRK